MNNDTVLTGNALELRTRTSDLAETLFKFKGGNTLFRSDPEFPEYFALAERVLAAFPEVLPEHLRSAEQAEQATPEQIADKVLDLADDATLDDPERWGDNRTIHTMVAEGVRIARGAPGIQENEQGELLYEKCADCHLFIDENAAYEPGSPWAQYVHLFGECDLCVATDESHEARPGGGHGTLDWWKANGPLLMRLRFVD
jgi:hypothetical protein